MRYIPLNVRDGALARTSNFVQHRFQCASLLVYTDAYIERTIP
jgi:hypothetical protein